MQKLKSCSDEQLFCSYAGKNIHCPYNPKQIAGERNAEIAAVGEEERAGEDEGEAKSTQHSAHP